MDRIDQGSSGRRLQKAPEMPQSDRLGQTERAPKFVDLIQRLEDLQQITQDIASNSFHIKRTLVGVDPTPETSDERESVPDNMYDQLSMLISLIRRQATQTMSNLKDIERELP